jgi:hypothetical protein
MAQRRLGCTRINSVVVAILTLLSLMTLPLSAQEAAAPAVAPPAWAAGPQLRASGGPLLPALALGLFAARELYSFAPVTIGIDADVITRKTAAAGVVCTADPCVTLPTVASVGDVMLHVRTRGSAGGWRPYVSLAGGLYVAVRDALDGQANNHIVSTRGTLVNFGVGLMPPAERGFFLEALLYRYSGLDLRGGDAISLGARSGWRW